MRTPPGLVDTVRLTGPTAAYRLLFKSVQADLDFCRGVAYTTQTLYCCEKNGPQSAEVNCFSTLPEAVDVGCFQRST